MIIIIKYIVYDVLCSLRLTAGTKENSYSLKGIPSSCRVYLLNCGEGWLRDFGMRWADLPVSCADLVVS